MQPDLTACTALVFQFDESTIMSMKIMKSLAAIPVLILFGLSLTVQAKPQCKQQPISELVKALAEAYEAKTLGSLDATKPYVGRVRIVIEHSLADDKAKDRFVVRWFTSLAKAEAWLKSRTHEGMPGRATKPLAKCGKGVCSYNFDSGILHNTLFLKKITYGVRGGCPYLKTIYLLDGD